MKVKEIMTKEIKSVSPDASARQALDLLQKMQISGLPVINEEGQLVGMFTEKDILSYALPSYIERVGSFVYEENPKAIRRKFAGLDGIKVSQLMRKEVVSVNEETTLCEAARLMLTQKARRLPVLDKSARVVGIVSRGDVLKALSEET